MKKLLALILLLPSLSFSAEIKLLTWNIFMIPKPINFSLQKTRSQEIAKQLAQTDYDVITLQEAFSPAARRRISKALALSHPYQIVLARDHFWRPANSGVIVFSKYPMEALDNVYFKNCTKGDCFSSKGALLVEITLPDGKKAQIASTHMQAWEDEVGRGIRKKQLVQIKDMLDENHQEGVPQFLVGDLNIDALYGNAEEYHSSLEFLNMTSAPLSGEYEGSNGFKVECYKTPGGEHPVQWLDHVWLNPRNSETTVVDKRVRAFTGILKNKECPLSDHNAVETIISL
mgnify:CR=1 FL=1